MPALQTPTATTTGRSLLVASTGGHLTQLLRLSERVELIGEPLWVTFDTPQSRSLLEGFDARFVPFVAPRDAVRVVGTLRHAWKIFQEHDVREVISTGSGVALGFLPMAGRLNIPAHFIESAARSVGPSMTGRVLRRTPGVRTYTQYPEWASGKWHFAGSMFDEFKPATAPRPDRPLKALVMLGTLEYRFDALVNRLADVFPADWDITWQLGPLPYRKDLPGEVWAMVPGKQLEAAAREADVIVAHAGVGSALTALTAGKHPILVPRDPARDEHVDDHQQHIARELSRLGVATQATPELLDAAILDDVVTRTVERAGTASRLNLVR